MGFKLVCLAIFVHLLIGKEVFNNAITDSEIIDPNNYFPGRAYG
jgi:hypothetical protein